MKARIQTTHLNCGTLLVLLASLALYPRGTALADSQTPKAESSAVVAGGGGGGGGGVANVRTGTGTNHGSVIVKSFEPVRGEGWLAQSDRSWLGVWVEEASEALGSQLGLPPGVGLLVTYITPDSPAAKAGLEKNDVLVAFDGQSLVHPAQLRKLVQVRKEGDKVELGLYRAGKKQTVSATLAKPPPGFGLLENGDALKGDLAALSRQFCTLPPGDAYRDLLNAYRDALGHVKIDQGKVQEEVHRSMEQARKALQEALRYSTNAVSDATAKALRELQRMGIMTGMGVMTDDGATVTVRSSGTKVQSVVKSDDSGTIVIVSNPKPRLTAHDKEGKLIFDGEIATPEQRAKVPPELWERAEPLLDKLAPKAEEPLDKPGMRQPRVPHPQPTPPPHPAPAGPAPTI
jgi:hypothetical protein